MDANLNISKHSMMPAGHHAVSDSTGLPLKEYAKTCLWGIFARSEKNYDCGNGTKELRMKQFKDEVELFLPFVRKHLL